MLEELEIRNLGPILQADIEFPRGLIAITGETGAGKSMLLSAIALISGGAADSSRVSPGQSQAWAQAVFTTDTEIGEAARIATEAGAVVDDGELFLTRNVPVAGRSKAVLNGNSVPRSVLQQVAAELVTVHGQADQLKIASHARQREFLDSYAGDSDQLDAYREVFGELTELDGRFAWLKNQQSGIAERAQFLRESIAQIDQVDPKPHEDVELEVLRTRIENSAQILEAVSGAVNALDPSALADPDGDSSSVVTLVRSAIDSLGPVSAFPEYQDSINRLSAASEELQDIVFELSSHLDFDGTAEADLDDVNARIHQLAELTRKWGPSLHDVLAWRQKAQYEIEDMDASPEQVQELESKRAELFERVLGLAGKLHDVRVDAAKRLSQNVNSELSALAMVGSSLDIAVVSAPDAVPSINGTDSVEFLFTPYPGSSPLPLGKSASGGELSRLMLALELSMATDRAVSSSKAHASTDQTFDQTFVFDEIDAGVGGVAALELGKRLALLARSVQVIVVTHLPQVASWADSQFVVSKTGQPVTTEVSEVAGDARVDEIARMLSGSVSATSRKHAEELLSSSVLESADPVPMNPVPMDSVPAQQQKKGKK